jgi:hypothetical protein
MEDGSWKDEKVGKCEDGIGSFLLISLSPFLPLTPSFS